MGWWGTAPVPPGAQWQAALCRSARKVVRQATVDLLPSTPCMVMMSLGGYIGAKLNSHSIDRSKRPLPKNLEFEVNDIINYQDDCASSNEQLTE